jgi:pimeloyl-ACP methyl ester carboxylesterase
LSKLTVGAPGDQASRRRVVLIHGAAHGAWCWEILTPKLIAHGFEVDSFDLPGLGDDRTPPQEVTFQSYVHAIRRVVEAKPGPVVMLGHSLGGWPMSAAAEALPHRVDHLVYLASFVPRDGEKIRDLSEAVAQFDGPSAFAALRPSAIKGAHEFAVELAVDTFYNLCAPGVADSAVRRLRPQADAPLVPAIRVSPGRFGAIAKTYVVCSKDRALPPAAQHWQCERHPDMRKFVLEADHSPFFSAPDALAALVAETLA